MYRLKLVLALALASLCTGWAAAQDVFPSRPITIVIPYPAGGTSDGQVRLFQEALGKLLGRPIIVDNKPGASGAIAAQLVAAAKPDGYTLLYPNSGVVIAPLLNDKAGYDALKDFKPITTTTAVPMVLVTNKSVPVKDAAAFLEYARKQPRAIMYGSAGTASYGHLASARFAAMANITVDHIPYKGEAATTMAVRGNEVQMLLTTPSSAMLGQVQQGNLTMLGVASAEPSPVVPGALPLNKVLPGFVSEVWFGLLAPAATPDDVVAKLNAAVRKVMDDEALKAKLLPTGAQARTSSPAELARMMREETVQWRDIVNKFKIKAD